MVFSHFLICYIINSSRRVKIGITLRNIKKLTYKNFILKKYLLTNFIF